MATCPSCKMSSRNDPDLMVVEEVFVPKPFGTFSLAGVGDKVITHKKLVLRCRCGCSVMGHIEDDHFVASGDS